MTEKGTRLQICDELAAAGCTTVGFEWNTDALVEQAWRVWVAQGRPKNAVVIVDRDLTTGRERTYVEIPQDTQETEVVYELET